MELDTSALKERELHNYVTEKAHEVIPNADRVIITGTTLINDTVAY